MKAITRSVVTMSIVYLKICIRAGALIIESLFGFHVRRRIRPLELCFVLVCVCPSFVGTVCIIKHVGFVWEFFNWALAPLQGIDVPFMCWRISRVGCQFTAGFEPIRKLLHIIFAILSCFFSYISKFLTGNLIISRHDIKVLEPGSNKLLC